MMLDWILFLRPQGDRRLPSNGFPQVPLLLDVVLSAAAYMLFLLVVGAIGREEWRFFRGLRTPVEEAGRS